MSNYLDPKGVQVSLELWSKYGDAFRKAISIGHQPRIKYRTRYETLVMTGKLKQLEEHGV